MNLPLAFRQLVEERQRKRSSDYQELARLVIEQVFAKARGEKVEPPPLGDSSAGTPSAAPPQAGTTVPPPRPEPAAAPPEPQPATSSPPVATVIPMPVAPAPAKQLSEVALAARAITSI